MKNLARRFGVLLGVILVSGASRAYAWDPPEPPAGSSATDQAAPPTTPTTPYPKAHGYLIQSGIDVLYNDGYWFAAQALRGSLQELLNGVRYADEKDGRQAVIVQECELFGTFCQTLYTWDSWPYAADNHYYNPDTGEGLSDKLIASAAAAVKAPITLLSGVNLAVYSVEPAEVDPPLSVSYTSALDGFKATYADALASHAGSSVMSIGGRTGQALTMFYLGWASHFMQDMTVVHHTFDDPFDNHAEYESAADGLVVPLSAGIYQAVDGLGINKLNESSCAPLPSGSRTCFASYAAHTTHVQVDLNRIEASVQAEYVRQATRQLGLAASLQAGVYAAFLNDTGQRPVHMSAVMAAEAATL